jgi:CRP-like cAMP-binding protein
MNKGSRRWPETLPQQDLLPKLMDKYLLNLFRSFFWDLGKTSQDELTLASINANMDKQPLIRFIKSNILHLTPQEVTIDHIASAFEMLRLEKGEFLVKQGKVGGYFIMLEGYLRAYTFTEKGDEVTTYFYPPNRVIFEAASFFGGNPSAENIQAITPCKGYHTSFEKLNEMFHAWPEFREFGRTVLVKEFVAYKQRMLSMINKSAEERYTELIRNSQDLFLYAQLKHIASFLGMTDTSLSRIRREFARK